MGNLRPIGHGERRYDGPSYVVFNLRRLPPGNNGVMTAWTCDLMSRLLFLLTGRLYIWFKSGSHPQMTVSTRPIGKWINPNKGEDMSHE